MECEFPCQKIAHNVFFAKFLALGAQERYDELYSMMWSGLLNPYFNKILLHTKTGLPEEEFEKIALFFEKKELPYSWLLPKATPPSAFLRQNCVQNCLSGTVLTTMLCPLGHIAPEPSYADIKQVTKEEELYSHYEVVWQNFRITEETATPYLARILSCSLKEESALLFFTGYLEGKAASSGCLLLGQEFASIYNIGTIPSARKCGLATKMMQTILYIAKARGYTYATLSATPQAKGLYQRLGFQCLEEYEVYISKDVARTGIEPATQGFSVLCSTI